MEFRREVKILISCEESGVVKTCRKYNVSTGTLYSWKKKHEKQGEAGLKVTYDVRKELKQAEEENRILRKLLATK
jgi:putative transposase